MDSFRTLSDWCKNDERIGVLTVWCFSTENWKRDPEEISKLMTMLEEYLEKERSEFLQNNTRFIHSGRRDRIPASLATLIEEAEDETNHCDGFTLHLAVDYGGQDEILRAIDKAGSRDFVDHLDHPELSDIDLIIRTSGEHRTSNFFLWQSVYSEWDFLNKQFPDFTVEDLKKSVDTFAARTRRFGGN